MDLALSFFLKRYVDKIVTFYGQSEIFGIPTVAIGNGINLEDNELVSRYWDAGSSPIFRIIGVANVRDYHGFDRVIVGMSEYSGSKEVRFDIVGGGSEIGRLKKLVSQYKLESKVIFHGVLSGKELDRVYSTADLAISTLCMHRRRLRNDSSLKTREYCARGIPFVMCFPDYDFPADFPYAYKVNSDDSSLNISEILDFTKKLINTVEVAEKMRDYARKNLTWDVKMPIVIEKIQEKI